MGDRFCLPESSWDQVSKIILGYFATEARGKDKYSLADVAHRSGVDKTTVSRNHKFLKSFGILEQTGSQYVLTPVGRELCLALEHQSQDKAKAVLNKLISASDFMTQIVDAVRIRSGMDYESLVSHIMMLASVPREARYKTGASTLIELLTIAGYFAKSGDLLVAVKGADVRVSEEVKGTEEVTVAKHALVSEPQTRVTSGPASVAVRITVSVTAADLLGHESELAQAIRALVRGIRSEGEPNA